MPRRSVAVRMKSTQGTAALAVEGAHQVCRLYFQTALCRVVEVQERLIPCEFPPEHCLGLERGVAGRTPPHDPQQRRVLFGRGAQMVAINAVDAVRGRGPNASAPSAFTLRHPRPDVDVAVGARGREQPAFQGKGPARPGIVRQRLAGGERRNAYSLVT